MLLQLFFGLLIFHVESCICHIQGGKCSQPPYQKGIVRRLSSCWNVNGWQCGVCTCYRQNIKNSSFLCSSLICSYFFSPFAVTVPCTGSNMFLVLLFCAAILHWSKQKTLFSCLVQVDVEVEMNSALNVIWQNSAPSFFLIWHSRLKSEYLISFRPYSFGSRCKGEVFRLNTVLTCHLYAGRVFGRCNHVSCQYLAGQESLHSATTL